MWPEPNCTMEKLQKLFSFSMSNEGTQNFSSEPYNEHFILNKSSYGTTRASDKL